MDSALQGALSHYSVERHQFEQSFRTILLMRTSVHATERDVAERQAATLWSCLSDWRLSGLVHFPFCPLFWDKGWAETVILDGKWLKLPPSFCQDKVLSVIFPCWEKKEAAGNRCRWVNGERTAAGSFQHGSLFCRRNVFMSVLLDKSLWQRNFRGALMSVAVAVL